MKFGLFTMPKSLLVSEPEIITKGVIAYQRALPPQSNSLPKRPNAQESLRTAIAMLEVEMQQGSLIRSGRKRGPDVWQFPDARRQRDECEGSWKFQGSCRPPLHQAADSFARCAKSDERCAHGANSVSNDVQRLCNGGKPEPR